MAEQPNSFQAEIKALEARLEEKKREMAAAGTEISEKHVFKTVIKEHGGDLPAPSAAPVQKPVTTQSNATLSPAEEQHLDTLITHAFTKGIKAAVSEARKSQMPYLIDALHDRLADEYYQKLLEARKINTE